MNHSIQRRHFLQKGALAVGALCLPAVGAMKAAAFGGVEQQALGFIRRYGDKIMFCCGAAPSTLDVTRLVALVRDIPQLSAAFHAAADLGIEKLHVAGTVATFRVGGRVFEVENLMHEDFTARLAEPSENFLGTNA